jgi:hypothetical protein
MSKPLNLKRAVAGFRLFSLTALFRLKYRRTAQREREQKRALSPLERHGKPPRMGISQISNLVKVAVLLLSYLSEGAELAESRIK